MLIHFAKKHECYKGMDSCSVAWAPLKCEASLQEDFRPSLSELCNSFKKRFNQDVMDINGFSFSPPQYFSVRP